MLQSIINYFRDCYVADQRDLTLWSIFDKKVESLYLQEGEENLVNGTYPSIFIPDDVAQKWLSTLNIYRKEKQLYYFSFLITGNTGVNLIGRKQICAPLVYYPASIEQINGDYFLSINFDQRQLNYPLISLLNTSEQRNNDYLEHIFEHFPQNAITFEECGAIQQALSTYLTQLNWDELYLYPQLADKAKLKTYQRKQQLHIVPAGAAGIVAGSRQTRGVLNELAAMAHKQTALSAPLHHLFEKQPIPSPKKIKDTKYVPVVLSHAQQQALENAQQYPLSMVIGPPGTGKSYTIASMAIDCFSRGQTVLIASKMNHAVDVISDKIEQQLNIQGIVIRAGRKNYLSELKREIKLILTGNRRKKTGEKLVKELEVLKEQVKNINASAEEVCIQFEERIQSQVKWADYLYKEQAPSWFLAKWFKDFKSKKIRAKIKKSSKLWEILHSVEAYTAKKHEIVSNFLKVISQYNVWTNAYGSGNRKHLNQFLNALRARTGSKQESLFKQINFDVILHTFPIWLVSLTDLYDVLPLQKELFDVAIIDEATQCDIASCLPLIQRAKRIVVVGDPSQLRHVSFLSKARERILVQENGLDASQADWLDYREKSILDLVNEQITQQDSVTFLNEHFRSLPEIISYSNQAFYGNELHVMSQNPLNNKKKALEFVQVNGKRKANGTNQEEVDFVIQNIQRLIVEEALLDADVCHKIGVLSPFREQVNYLRKKLVETISPEDIVKHDIQVGTAHSFQGEERDLMFLSFVVDGKSPSGSFVHINKPDVFNVSITRARVKQYVLLSVSVDQLKAGTHLHNYITNARQNNVRSNGTSQSAIYDDFLTELMNELQAKDIQCYPQYPLAGLEVDLVAESGKKVLGIDLIGWSETMGKPFSLERYQILNRAGLKIIPLPFTLWREYHQDCLDVILGEFNQHIS